ncbi:Detected protein of unknown function [Hibiscus syriacus]|uniref:glucan endo-1,3-beta-D-glucosidase n=1 Tax=Hibiscus syriacus TaxID=106335 RepID=A0A6A2X2Z4_HIBSY|nr:Detected protein of unknown function [Hibiscus syriacus]KAE8669274.1 Detected protein of unknown function [Hibiscus syriacus]
MINPYPYFELNEMEKNVDYAVFRKTPGVFDPYRTSTSSSARPVGLPWVIPGNFAATIDNAASYNGHLIRKIVSGFGTPLMPNWTFDAYIFALFNENQKPGPVAERNWGLFQPDYTPVYVAGALRDGPAPSLNNPSFMVERSRRVPHGGRRTPRVPQVNNPQFRPSIQPAMPQPVLGATNAKKFCVPKPGVPDDQLQKKLDFACSQGAHCSPIQPGAICAAPATVGSRAMYAMNSFFRIRGVDSACDFSGTGQITTVDPSYGNCRYP